MSGPGRPSILTEAVRDKILSALGGGNFRVAACEYAGVSARTFREWMARGARGDKDYEDFRRAVIEAEKRAEIRAVALILRAAENDPRHAQWWLSHRWPERWADKSRHEISGKKGAPLAVADMTREEIRAALRTIASCPPQSSSGALEEGVGCGDADRDPAG